MNWTRRRSIVAALVIATTALLSFWLASVLSAGGFYFVAAIMVVAFALKFSWVAINFWNAVIGFALMRQGRAWLDGARPVRKGPALKGRVAIAMTICNEDTVHVIARLRSVKASLDASGYSDQFDFFLLSDSSHPDIVAAENRAAELWQNEIGGRFVYRRRPENSGAQHGNLYEFCQRFGGAYEVMIVLDADSLMTAGAIIQLVEIMQANPRIGILQSVNCGILLQSLFARIFEFGHRHGMRCWIAGAVWWQGERGQYRGHNAAIRVAAYTEHSNLSRLPGDKPFGGVMFCHDQIESLMMHRAGYEIREMPVEHGSYEGAPPALTDFTIRYGRWFQGNLKNLRMLRLPALTAMDRYHLIGVAHRFMGWPAVITFVALAAFLTLNWPKDAPFPVGSALLLYASYFAIYFTPKILGLLDSALHAPQDYGGVIPLIAGGCLDLMLTLLFLPVVMLTATFLAIGFIFGHDLKWSTQQREGYSLSWADACHDLWPQTGIGVALLTLLACKAPMAIPWFLPFLAGLVLVIPMAVMTSSTKLNRLAARWKLCALPEEINIPPEIASVLAFEIQNSKPGGATLTS